MMHTPTMRRNFPPARVKSSEARPEPNCDKCGAQVEVTLRDDDESNRLRSFLAIDRCLAAGYDSARIHAEFNPRETAYIS